MNPEILGRALKLALRSPAGQLVFDRLPFRKMAGHVLIQIQRREYAITLYISYPLNDLIAGKDISLDKDPGPGF